MIGICVRMVILCTFILSSQSVLSQEKVYWDVVQKIRDEGFKRSKVMETASYLTDVYGPRLAHSPSYNAAAEWAKSRLETVVLPETKAPRMPMKEERNTSPSFSRMVAM